MTLNDKLRHVLRASKEKNEDNFEAGRPLGDTGTCSPSYHRHSDKYKNRCHPIKLKHRKKGDKPHGTNPALKNSPLKKLQVKGS